MDLSLFFFADDAAAGTACYDLLLASARFADDNGFSAVWTPERHFHPFGGRYPNPAVVGAALAAVTTRVGIRAGSVVAPLHHPDGIRGHIVKAYVILKPGWKASDDLKSAVQRHVRARLSQSEYPREIEFVTDLPKTRSGKIIRKELRERARQELDQHRQRA